MCEAIYVLRGFVSRGRCKRIVNPKTDKNWQILINQWTWRRQCNFKRLWKHGVRANLGRDWNWLFVCGGAPVHFRGKAITVTPAVRKLCQRCHLLHYGRIPNWAVSWDNLWYQANDKTLQLQPPKDTCNRDIAMLGYDLQITSLNVYKAPTSTDSHKDKLKVGGTWMAADFTHGGSWCSGLLESSLDQHWHSACHRCRASTCGLSVLVCNNDL